MTLSRRQLASFLVIAPLLSSPASATDLKPSIKLGQTMPYSGPASSYSIVGRVQLAYFKMINEAGGVNSHLVDLISFGLLPDLPSFIRRVCSGFELLPFFGPRAGRFQACFDQGGP
jgi:hypothetical protein